jgi:hypothetical protein
VQLIIKARNLNLKKRLSLKTKDLIDWHGQTHLNHWLFFFDKKLLNVEREEQKLSSQNKTRVHTQQL